MSICSSFHSHKEAVEPQASSGDEYIPEDSSADTDSSVDEDNSVHGESSDEFTPSASRRRKAKGKYSARVTSSRSGTKSQKARTVTPKRPPTTPVSVRSGRY